MQTLLLEREMKVGKITRKAWRYEPTATFKKTEVNFVVKGFFNRRGLLTQAGTNTLLAEITFSWWRRDAQIILSSGKTYSWKFSDFWHTRWELNGNDNTRILYNGHSLKGEITVYSGDEITILAGLLIAHCYWHLRRKSS